MTWKKWKWLKITSEAITGSRAAPPVIHYQQTWLLGVYHGSGKGLLPIWHIDPKKEYKTRASASARDWATTRWLQLFLALHPSSSQFCQDAKGIAGILVHPFRAVRLTQVGFGLWNSDVMASTDGRKMALRPPDVSHAELPINHQCHTVIQIIRMMISMSFLYGMHISSSSELHGSAGGNIHNPYWELGKNGFNQVYEESPAHLTLLNVLRLRKRNPEIPVNQMQTLPGFHQITSNGCAQTPRHGKNHTNPQPHFGDAFETGESRAKSMPLRTCHGGYINDLHSNPKKVMWDEVGISFFDPAINHIASLDMTISKRWR